MEFKGLEHILPRYADAIRREGHWKFADQSIMGTADGKRIKDMNRKLEQYSNFGGGAPLPVVCLFDRTQTAECFRFVIFRAANVGTPRTTFEFCPQNPDTLPAVRRPVIKRFPDISDLLDYAKDMSLLSDAERDKEMDKFEAAQEKIEREREEETHNRIVEIAEEVLVRSEKKHQDAPCATTKYKGVSVEPAPEPVKRRRGRPPKQKPAEKKDEGGISPGEALRVATSMPIPEDSVSQHIEKR